MGYRSAITTIDQPLACLLGSSAANGSMMSGALPPNESVTGSASLLFKICKP
jgi:hypothetical protein